MHPIADGFEADEEPDDDEQVDEDEELEEGSTRCSICRHEEYFRCGHLVGDCEDYSLREPHPLHMVEVVEELLDRLKDLCLLHDLQAKARAWLDRDEERRLARRAAKNGVRPAGRRSRARRSEPDYYTLSRSGLPAWCQGRDMEELVAGLRENYSLPCAAAMLAAHDTSALRRLCATWIGDPAAALGAADEARGDGTFDFDPSAFLSCQCDALYDLVARDCHEVRWSVDKPCMSQSGRAWLHEDPARFLREVEEKARAILEGLPRP